MKHFFYRAKLLLITIAFVALLFILLGMAFVKAQASLLPMPWLSEYTVGGFITSNDESKVRDVLFNNLDKNSERFNLSIPLYVQNAYAVYLSPAENNELVMIKGRFFNKNDYEHQKNVVVISDNFINKCINDDGVYRWQYEGNMYEVIGIFKGENEFGPTDTDLYINYFAKALDDAIFCDYIYDSGVNTLENIDKVDQELNTNESPYFMEYAEYLSKEGESYILSATNSSDMIMLLIIVLLLVVINSSSVYTNWIDSHKQEIFIRKLLGATNIKIYFWILKFMLIFTLLGTILGVCLTKLFLFITDNMPVSDSVGLLFGTKISLSSLLIGFVFLLMTCLIITTIALISYNKKPIAEFVR